VSEHYAVILCGGYVTRFWPLSRTLSPTQLLVPNGYKTLLQQTAARLTKLTVTHEDHKCEVKRRQTKPFKDLRGLRIESTRVFA
jgi:mannose-1-phosphate guanylyltransferase